MTKRPKLIVFDLDYTLWPFWVDTHVDPPFRKSGDGKVIDSSGRKIKYYPDVPKILERLTNEGIPMGVASRTEWPAGARQLLKMLDWEKYFSYQEIYPGSKLTHFQRFQEVSGVPYSQMIFFDDEHRNICEISKLGVTSVFVPKGLTNKVLEEGFKQFEREHS
ncbi:magnesium-dependent phosphatase 1-like isoform X2 [Tachypleus tridentatus]|uniref:magnesium-dependent phosphatase 1-like isoform X2 n=1 Tax=Tachypleus tridentatus TaxID=6853 RepID=UPI003FD6731F